MKTFLWIIFAGFEAPFVIVGFALRLILSGFKAGRILADKFIDGV